MTRQRSLGRLVVALATLVGGCGADEEPACRVDAECASGRCGSDGRCESGGPSGSSSGSAASSSTGAASCTPNGDGVVLRSEIVLGPGLAATFRVARAVTVDTKGSALSDGRRRWDLSAPLPGEVDASVETASLDGAWYAADFADATYRVTLSDEPPFGELEGVFEVGEALFLRGLASPSASATATRVGYAPAVPVLRFPLAEGEAWTTDATVAGLSLGVPATYAERYESAVDARGELVTPYGTFPVLRVRTTVTRTVGLLSTVTRSFAFVSECFGTVATVRSNPGEGALEFTKAAEVRRLAP
ncbi:MAG: hypothetical protein FJ095_17265 [Deltaproteobacteria bacterium]|nr:hypothetical protein [Deltaproteobacteria bacterium]